MKKIFGIIFVSVLFFGCTPKDEVTDAMSENTQEILDVNSVEEIAEGVVENEENSFDIEGSENSIDELNSGDIIEVKEKLFVAQINDMYYNAEDYLGKTIKYEGLLDIAENSETGQKYYSVIRYGPGCCGDDGYVGFEVNWDNDNTYPEKDEWVEVVGILESYEEDGFKYLRLDLQELNVLEVRGKELVTQ